MGILDSTCPDGITLLTNGTKTFLNQGQRSWDGRSSGMAPSTASSLRLSNCAAIWPCHTQYTHNIGRRQCYSQFQKGLAKNDNVVDFHSFIPHIWARGVVPPSYLPLSGGWEFLLNYHYCSETLSRLYHYGWKRQCFRLYMKTVHNTESELAKNKTNETCLKCSVLWRLQNVASLVKASWICRDEFCVSA